MLDTLLEYVSASSVPMVVSCSCCFVRLASRRRVVLASSACRAEVGEGVRTAAAGVSRQHAPTIAPQANTQHGAAARLELRHVGLHGCDIVLQTGDVVSTQCLQLTPRV